VAPVAVAAGARDVAKWVVLVGGLVANAFVPVVAKKYHMSGVFHVTRCAVASVVPPWPVSSNAVTAVCPL
jgi:hypothetical protein